MENTEGCLPPQSPEGKKASVESETKKRFSIEEVKRGLLEGKYFEHHSSLEDGRPVIKRVYPIGEEGKARCDTSIDYGESGGSADLLISDLPGRFDEDCWIQVDKNIPFGQGK